MSPRQVSFKWQLRTFCWVQKLLTLLINPDASSLPGVNTFVSFTYNESDLSSVLIGVTGGSPPSKRRRRDVCRPLTLNRSNISSTFLPLCRFLLCRYLFIKPPQVPPRRPLYITLLINLRFFVFILSHVWEEEMYCGVANMTSYYGAK